MGILTRKYRPRRYDQGLLQSQCRRSHDETQYPVGWYFARFNEHLRPGSVVPVEFMGQKFALFRTPRGRVGMIDARCCHMGADLGRCGTLHGENLLCGYHAWEFDADGECVHIPGLDRAPRTAHQNAVNTIEHAGNIWFWYGPGDPEPFDQAGYADSKEYMNIRGEVHIGRSDPLPIMEHISDISHFPHNHKSTGELEYRILRDEGTRFEFQLRPVMRKAKTKSIQGLFKPYGLITMVSPCTGVYRTQSGPELNRSRPFLSMILGVSPVRQDVSLFTWRIAVRKVGPDIPFYPFNRALGILLWLIIRKNVHADLEVLKWMDPEGKTLWVNPDGPSVRQFRRYYQRNIVGDPLIPIAHDIGGGALDLLERELGIQQACTRDDVGADGAL